MQIREHSELQHLWRELPGVFHSSMNPLHRALIGCSHRCCFLRRRPKSTCVGLEVSCTFFKNLQDTWSIRLSFVYPSSFTYHLFYRQVWSLTSHYWDVFLNIADLRSVGGIRWSGRSHGEQFDRRGGVTENIRYLLGHHLLHVLPEVLLEQRVVMCPLEGAVHQHYKYYHAREMRCQF